MNISLTPRLEAMIREKVESGLYNNSSEVVREALRLMEQEDALKRERLRAAIAVGMNEIARGEDVEYTPELMADVDREVDRMVRDGDALDPDVCP
jgi:antitoxin ParD1/3/4